MQVLAGLCEQTSGTVYIDKSPPRPTDTKAELTKPTPTSAASPTQPPRGAKFAARMSAENRPVRRAQSPDAGSGSANQQGSPQGLGLTQGRPLSAANMEERMGKVGIVFQFPERHFLGADVLDELTFTWPKDPRFFMQEQALRQRVVSVSGDTHTYPPRRIHTQAHAHTHADTRAHTHARTQTHNTHTHTHFHTRLRVPTHPHTRTHSRTRARHTHTHSAEAVQAHRWPMHVLFLLCVHHRCSKQSV